MTTFWALAAGIVAVIGIIIHYEMDYNELSEWANTLSEECADLYRENAALRGQSWTR